MPFVDVLESSSSSETGCDGDGLSFGFGEPEDVRIRLEEGFGFLRRVRTNGPKVDCVISYSSLSSLPRLPSVPEVILLSSIALLIISSSS